MRTHTTGKNFGDISMAESNTEIRYLKGIGEKKALAFNKLGVFTIRDLVSLFPRKYEDRTQFKPIALTMPDETVCIQAIVADTPRLSRIRKGLDLVKFRAVDESGSVDITYFNQSYIKNQIQKGETYNFYGKISIQGSKRSMTNPVHERDGVPGGITGRIVPVYPLVAGLTQKNVLSSVQQALDICRDTLPDVLPEEVREKYKLAQAGFAYKNIHNPADFESLEIARRRLVFEELFLLACALGQMKDSHGKAEGIKLEAVDLHEFWASLPFAPTGAQRRAVDDALSDMQSGKAMNRLVQGDVGSGKTLVAAALMWAAWKNGLMSAFMAPTEILAEQHCQTLTELLSPFGIRIGKLTGSMTAKQKREVKALLSAGEVDIIIGTHALFTEDVEYKNLGLVVTDEQHRFGVNQRSAMI